MNINGAKTKIMSIGAGTDDDQPTITLRGNALEAVEEFSYLGSKVGQTARVDGEVSTRLERTATVYQMWRRKVFRSRSVSKKTKAHVFRVTVMSVLLYGSETWAVTQQDLKRLHAFQMKCLRDIIGVTSWNKRRNEDILAEVGEIPVEDQVKLRSAMVWSPPKDASPPATATGAEMPATRQEEEAWRNLTLLDRCCR